MDMIIRASPPIGPREPVQNYRLMRRGEGFVFTYSLGQNLCAIERLGVVPSFGTTQYTGRLPSAGPTQNIRDQHHYATTLQGSYKMSIQQPFRAPII